MCGSNWGLVDEARNTAPEATTTAKDKTELEDSHGLVPPLPDYARASAYTPPSTLHTPPPDPGGEGGVPVSSLALKA